MIVYIATNKINGKSYIGQTIQKLSCRISGHKYNSITLGTRRYFYNAIRKYGFENFEWNILCECDTKDELDEMEYHYIKQYHTHHLDNGYNLSYGGEENNVGFKMSDETKEKMSRSRKGQIPWIKGRHHTDETKEKISICGRGDGNGFYGKHHTDETKEKIRKVQVGCKSKFSKSYEITYPNGSKIIIKGIRQFCRDNNLSHQLMCAVSKGKQKHHKGYKCMEIHN